MICHSLVYYKTIYNLGIRKYVYALNYILFLPSRQCLTVFSKNVNEGKGKWQGCGSGSGLDPDSMTLRIWIRNSDPDPWARKMKKKSTFPKLLKPFYS
jgi:hypothetical protein